MQVLSTLSALMLSSDRSSKKLTCRPHPWMWQSTNLIYSKVSTISGPWMHWVTFPASSYPGFNLSEGQVNLQQPMAIAPLTDLWAVIYVHQLSRLKFSAPVMPMYFYWIYTYIYSISQMMSSWLLHWLCHNLTWLPIHPMNICILIILVKFQNYYTRISPYTVPPHGSSWKSWQDASRHHWDFTAWPLDQSWLGIKAATTGQNLDLVFKFSSFWLRGFKIHTSSGL